MKAAPCKLESISENRTQVHSILVDFIFVNGYVNSSLSNTNANSSSRLLDVCYSTHQITIETTKSKVVNFLNKVYTTTKV